MSVLRHASHGEDTKGCNFKNSMHAYLCVCACVFMLVQTKCGLVLVSDNSFYSIVLVLTSNIAIYT